jgi:long-chain fatty acid transport protein
MKRYRATTAAVTIASTLFMVSETGAAGFALIEHSASGIGRSYAGATAGAELESSVHYNPAGIASAAGPSVSVASHLLMTSVSFDGASQYPALGGAPLSGGDGGESGVDIFVPNIYAVTPIAKGVAVGLGVFVPFGLAIDYNEGWVGRYHALESSLETVNINPTVAWQVTDKLSVGAGFSAQYAEAKLSSAIDFGTIAQVAPGLLDGKGTMSGNDWGYGYDLGFIYALTPASRVGLCYRSSIDHTVDGNARFEVPAPVAGIQALGVFVDTTGSAEVELPASASLGYIQQLGEKLAVMVDIVWTEWSSLKELRIEYDSMQPDSVTDESWKDVWRVTLGGEYYVSPAWTLRAGTAFDESPIPDVEHRTPRIPDSDRAWLTAGLGYKASDRLSVDVGYAHVFFEDSEINRLSDTGDNLAGDYSGAADIFSFQLKLNI